MDIKLVQVLCALRVHDFVEETVLFKGDKQAGLARVKEAQPERSVSPAGEHIGEGPDATDRRVCMLCSKEMNVYFYGRFSLNSF